ncbi:MAG TPA: hypothetical protein VH307_05765, partial [Streptosporangiaceae bacterium]|nr:hypothetical protein [Streptosporangiaceae bacterium]
MKRLFGIPAAAILMMPVAASAMSAPAASGRDSSAPVPVSRPAHDTRAAASTPMTGAVTTPIPDVTGPIPVTRS